MPDDLPRRPVPLAQQIRCLQRELRMRERVYPRWVADGRMSPENAEHETAAMAAALETLQRLAEGDQKTLF